MKTLPRFRLLLSRDAEHDHRFDRGIARHHSTLVFFVKSPDRAAPVGKLLVVPAPLSMVPIASLSLRPNVSCDCEHGWSANSPTPFRSGIHRRDSCQGSMCAMHHP